MIEIKSPDPTTINFVCSTQEELDFCESHKNEVFNEFIKERTGKFETLEEYLKFAYDDSDFYEFGNIAIKAKWAKLRELHLDWDASTIGAMADKFNEKFKRLNDNWLA